MRATCSDEGDTASARGRVTRRAVLAGAGAMLVGSAAAGVGAVARPSDGPATARAFDGGRQAGIVTPRQAHLTLAAFDLVTPDRADLPRLLSAWTELTVALVETTASGPGDTGERAGL